MRTILGLVLALLLPTTTLAQYGPQPYTPVRWDEDYSDLADPQARTDRLDPLKFIPLSDDGASYLSLGGQVRYRYEHFDDANFGAGPQDGDGYHLWRFLGHADLHLGEHVRIFAQGKSAQIENRTGGPRPIDEDELELQQAFADLTLPLHDSELTLRAGRQDLIYGAQRLISPLDWANTRRTFQGGRASWQMTDLTLDLFLVQPVTIDADGWNEGDDDTTFGGAYAVRALPGMFGRDAGTRWETYLLGLFKDPPSGPESDRYTLGARFRTAPRPWDLDLETAWQFGEIGDDSISAWMLAVESGYTLDALPLSPRPFIGFDVASGGASDERFDQLFPLGHAYFGYIDAIGRQNIVDLHAGMTFTLRKGLTLRLDQHLFWRYDRDDAVYNAAGGILRADSGSDARSIGSEFDLLLNWQISRHWSAYGGWSHFRPGDFIDETGADEAISFTYVAVLYTF